MTPDFKELQNRYADFVEEREWQSFHTPKNLSMSIAVEAAELMEIFQWHDNLQASDIKEDNELMDRIEEELADVVIYCMGLAASLDIDLIVAVERKLDENEDRFDSQTADEMIDNLQQWQRE